MSQTAPPLMPVRRLHNYIYCPRLFYLQWVEDLWVENADTAKGSHLHRNTDKPSHGKDDLDLAERASLRSVALESETLGLRGIVDLIEDTGTGRELIDYKKGSARRDEDGNRIAKKNDALQITAYAMMLRESGQPVTRGSIYYGEERSRVTVELTPEREEQVLETISEARRLAASGTCPPPLKSDPRCLHCSAYSICLPNETNHWEGRENTQKAPIPPRPPSDEGEILVVQEPKARLSLRSGEIRVKLAGDVVSKLPIEQVQAVYLYGAVQASTQLVHALIERNISIAYFSPAGRFIGITQGLPASGIDARLGQSRVFHTPDIALPVLQEMIRAKIHNQRVLLMRNGDVDNSALVTLAKLRDQASSSENISSLRGIEGAAAALYFSHFSKMIKSGIGETFDFDGRNRRPPKDPVNAMLSQGYSILAKELTGMCHAAGLDPFIGIYHRPRFGRPALALDLMEEFRPLVADSVVISLINRQEIDESDFVFTSKGVFLTQSGRRQFWRAWFRRMDTEVKHPEFGYRMSYRRMLDVQVRQLWRWFRGDVKFYAGFTTR